MSEKHKCTSHSRIQMKSLQKVIGNEEKLDAISRLEKGEQIVHIHHNVRLACSSVRMIPDNVD